MASPLDIIVKFDTGIEYRVEHDGRKSSALHVTKLERVETSGTLSNVLEEVSGKKLSRYDELIIPYAEVYEVVLRLGIKWSESKAFRRLFEEADSSELGQFVKACIGFEWENEAVYGKGAVSKALELGWEGDRESAENELWEGFQTYGVPEGQIDGIGKTEWFRRTIQRQAICNHMINADDPELVEALEKAGIKPRKAAKKSAPVPSNDEGPKCGECGKPLASGMGTDGTDLCSECYEISTTANSVSDGDVTIDEVDPAIREAVAEHL